jgi:hypothetical protein
VTNVIRELILAKFVEVVRKCIAEMIGVGRRWQTIIVVLLHLPKLQWEE